MRTGARREHVVLGRLVRELREAAGMTQRELAARIDRTQAYVWKVETGMQHLDIATLIDLARLLGGDAPGMVSAVEAECRPDA